MAIVITDQGNIGAASGTTLAITLVSNISAGDSICVGTLTNGTNAGTLSDDAGNVYSLVDSGNPNNNTANGVGALWVCHSCLALSSGQKITWTKPTSGIWSFSAGSITGGPFITDVNPTPTTGTGNANPSISSGVLASANEAVFGCLCTNSTAAPDTITNPSGWTVPFSRAFPTGGGPCVRGGSIVVSSTSSVTYNPTISVGRAFILFLASFKISIRTIPQLIGLSSPEIVSRTFHLSKNVSPISESQQLKINKSNPKRIVIQPSSELVKSSKSINKVIII
jgi:hypothetical protein